MFYTFGGFERLFLRGFDIWYWGFVVPPPQWDNQLVFAWVRDLAGDNSHMAISCNFELNRV